MSIRSLRAVFASVGTLAFLAACSLFTLAPAPGAPSVDTYIGKRCSGIYYGKGFWVNHTFPYIFKIVKFRQGPPGLSALYADGTTLSGAHVHSATVKGGDLIIRTSPHVTFRGVPIDPRHIHMYRFVKGPQVSYLNDSMATCKPGAGN